MVPEVLGISWVAWLLVWIPASPSRFVWAWERKSGRKRWQPAAGRAPGCSLADVHFLAHRASRTVCQEGVCGDRTRHTA